MVLKDGDKTGLTNSSRDQSKKEYGLENWKQTLQSKCNYEQSNISSDEEMLEQSQQDFARKSEPPAISHFFNASRDGDRHRFVEIPANNSQNSAYYSTMFCHSFCFLVYLSMYSKDCLFFCHSSYNTKNLKKMA